MSRVSKRAVGLAALTALVGGTFAGLAAAPAYAAYPSSPPASALTADPNSANGTITFYDAAGHVVTGGTNLAHLFDYARASTNGLTGSGTKATAYFAFPDHTQSDSLNWNSQIVTASTTYPNATYPAPLNSATQPVVKATASDANLSGLLGTSSEDTTAGYQGYLQIRLFDSSPTSPAKTATGPWWATIIEYDKTAGTWQQVYPAVPTTTVSAITASPVSPAPAGTTSVALSASLTASDSSHPTGSVELFDGATDLGAATFNASTGAISKTATVVDNGSYNFKFVYTPDVAYAGSSSPVLAYSVKGPSQATTTVLSGPTSTTMGTPVTIHADVYKQGGTVAVPASAGAVQFKVDGTNSGSPVALTATGADYQFSPTAVGSNTITASFVPVDPTAYQASSDNTGVTVATTAPAYNPDPQNVTVNVPQGTLVISTPYTASNPFDLGTMQLNGAGTLYTASKPFGDPTAPAAVDPGNGATASTSNGVTITDTRAASTGWTAYAQTTDFTNPSLSTVIDGNNLTFSSITPKYLSGNNLQSGDVTVPAGASITGFKTAKKSFASTAKGPGTVNITGVLGLTAPTSTKFGQYTATVTFTIV